ncbi:MAG: hypothetical protein ACOVNU_14070 [Candidatus Kapaibacteriota bacterium]|jgi:hypothetical protein
MTEPIKIKQISLYEASKEFNIPLRQLKNAVTTKLLKHYKVGQQTRTTNIAVMQFLNKLTDGMDLAPERQNYDMERKLKEIDRPNANMKEKIKNLVGMRSNAN